MLQYLVCSHTQQQSIKRHWMMVASITPDSISEKVYAPYFLGLFVQFSNLSRPGYYYIHLPYTPDLRRKSGIIKIHP